MNSATRRIIALFIFLLTTINGQLLFAETIRLKSGKTIAAVIMGKTLNYIKVDFNGVALTYYSDEIGSIIRDTQTVAPPEPTIETPADKISRLIEDVSQSVVVIETKRDTNNLEGTGFFVSADGLVATNLHVAFKARSITIRTKNGRTYSAQFVANFDDRLDICLLKIDIADAPALTPGDSNALKAGQIIFTIGHREGSRYQTSSGPYLDKSI